MKKVLGKIAVIAVIIAVIYAVYAFVLPEYPQSYVKSLIQPKINSTADMRINQVKQLMNKDLKLNYETILTTKTNTACWIYEEGTEENGYVEHVYFYGKGVGVNLKDWPEFTGLMYTSTRVKIDFAIIGNDITITPYVDDLNNPLKLDEKVAGNKNKNDKLKQDIFEQIYGGMKSEN